MMKDCDLATFLSLLDDAERDKENGPFEPASHFLEKLDGLFSSEIWRLSRSLRIGSAAGRCPSRAADAADQIWTDMREKRCAPFSDVDLWKKAIKWALVQGGSPYRTGNTDARQNEVGKAYLSLEKQGFSVKLSAYGLEIDARGQIEIFRKAESLVALLGGLEVLKQICEYMNHSNKIHDGMWMFGDQVPNIMQTKSASPPIAWLFAIAMKHLGRRNTARKPTVAWKSLINLATAAAATLDCERYNQFEGIDMHPSQFWRSMLDSLFWREFFTMPQVPTVALYDILDHLRKTIEIENGLALSEEMKIYLQEVMALSRSLRPDGLAIINRERASKAFPKLMKMAFGKIGAVNAEMVDLFSASKREHERTLLFEIHNRDILVLPQPLFNAAACEIAFIKVWKEMPNHVASKIVGATMEAVLSENCQGKAPILKTSERYLSADGKTLEMDVASREADEIVLIETKAKSMTAQSRDTGGFAYISDYTKSYLAMMKQLMVHEKNIRCGSNPIVKQGETYADFRPLKVAVSPLSYGQLSDKVFASSIIRGLFNASLTAVSGQDTEENIKIIEKFNQSFADVRGLVGDLAPKREGLAELAPYLIDFFWVDLGQAVYLLKRGLSVSKAFKPLKHITYSTRDFWTEVAIVERGGLTQSNWTPLPQ